MNSQFEDQACLYVLNQLGARERAIFEARLAHDTELAALVRDLEDVIEGRVRALPQHEPPAGLLRRIESEIDGDRGSQAAERARRFSWSAAARWGIAAVIAVSAGTLAVQSLKRSPEAAPTIVLVGLDPHRSTLSEIPIEGRADNSDARFAQLASLAEKMWAAPGRESVRSKRSEPGESAYALFDPGSSQGFLSVGGLPEAEAGKSYHLWVLDTRTGLVREAGVLPAAGNGRGLFFFSVSPMEGSSPPSKLAFFVTAEDSGNAGLESPRGKVVLGNRGI